MAVVAVLGLTVGELAAGMTTPTALAVPKAAAEKVLVRPDAISASISARSQGIRVEVESERTETTSTWVNPDGTFTTEAFAGPVRVRGVDGAWRDVDFDLVRAEDGSVAPRVHPAGLRLSGPTTSAESEVVSVVGQPVRDSGRGVSASKAARARIKKAQDSRAGFAWPGKLPAPVLDGTKATYRDVEPGVDLVVTVLRTGYEQHVVIKTPAALAALKTKAKTGPVSWDFPIKTKGLTARTADDGAVELVDAKGVVSWRYGAPQAWDAKTDAHTGDPTSVSALALSVKQSGAGRAVVSVTPDAAWLNDPARQFPITIDPYAAATGWSSFDTTIANNVTTDLSASTDLTVGSANAGATVARSFINFPLAVFKGKKIMSANLYPVETGSYSCTASEVKLFETATVTTATRWTNQPGSTTAGTSPYGRLTVAKGYSSACPSGRVSIPMTTLAQKWADNTATGGTLRLTAGDETSSTGWKKFASREATTTGVPQISLTYNRKPNAAATPAPVSGSVFPFTPPGSTVTTNYVNTLKPTLTSTATDPDGTTLQLTTEVHTSTTASSTTLAGTCVTGYVASGATGSCTLPTALTDSVRYYARTAVYDGTTWNGTWSPWYTFVTAAATAPNADAGISCPGGFSDGVWDDAPSGNLVCTVTAAAPLAKSAAPGYIKVKVDGLLENTIKIVPSTDPAVAKTTVTVPNNAGGHKITATAVMVTNIEGTPKAMEFGFGSTVNITKPGSRTRPTAWGAIAVEGLGSPVYKTCSMSCTAVSTGKLQWKVAGGSDGEWVDGSTLTTSTNKTGSVTVTGTFDVRSATTQADGTELNPRIPVLLDVRPCIMYTNKPMECAAGGRRVLRVPHAFGNGFPTADVGIGQVALFTGEFNTDTTDVSVPGYTGDLSLSRSHSTYGNDPIAATDITTGVFGPGWTANIDGGDAGAAGLQVVDSTRIDGTIALVGADRSAQVFTTPDGARRTTAGLASGTYKPADDDTILDGSTLVVGDFLGTDGKMDIKLTEDDGTVTTFAGLITPAATANGTFAPGTVRESGAPGATTFSTDASGRVTRILAPVPTGVTCTTMAAGCRALNISYGSVTSDTEVLGQVSQVTMTIHSATSVAATTCAGTPATLAGPMVTVPVACYAYDAAHRLASVKDPRNGLSTTYTYDANNRITSVRAAGTTKVDLSYIGTGAGQTPKLSTVTHARPAPETGTATTSSIVYGVPVTGNAGLPDLSATQTSKWNQGRMVTYGAAVFDAGHPAPSTDPTALTAADWQYADLSYTDIEGYTTNTASYGAGAWQVTATDYDGLGNVTRQLDAGAIATVVADGAPARADQLSTQTVYNAELTSGSTILAPAGSLVTDTYGPARMTVLKNGTSGLVRPHTHTTYDQGAPNGGINPATDSGYNLATTQTSSATDVATGTDLDTSTTLTLYTPIDAKTDTDPTSGWVLGAPTQVVQDLDSTGTVTTGDIVNRTRYDAEGRVVETRQPSATTGTGPQSTLTAYYQKDPLTGVNAACGGKPQWVGLICRSYPADHGSGTGVVADSTTTGFNYLLAPTIVVGKSAGTTPGGVTRTSTTTYLLDGRPETTLTTVTGLASSVPQAGTKIEYSPTTGAVSAVVKLDSAGAPTTTKSTSTYDSWGRVTTSTNELGDLTSAAYDAAGRTATITDAKGVTTFTYDGTDAAGKVERRGVPTKLTVTRAGTASTAENLLTFTAAYDGDGALVKQTMPGNITQRTTYDDAGEPVQRSYSGQVTPVTSSVDADGNTVYTPGTPVQDQPWLVWHQDNDITGRVRHESTPDGAAFNADPGAVKLGDVVPNTGDALAVDRTYTYDNADRLTQVTDRTATATDTQVDGMPSMEAPCQVRTYTFASSGAGLNGNRTSSSVATPTDGTCTATAANTVTKTYAYDGADRQTTPGATGTPVGSYTYDPLGRQTLMPAADAPDSTQGDITLGYFDTDLPDWVQQNNIRTTYTLDVASRRLVSETGPAASAPSSTTTRHYSDGSDNPAWVDVDNDAAGPVPSTAIRFIRSLSGDLGGQIASDGSANLALASPHGDTSSTLTIPASQSEDISSTEINAWSDYTEFGTIRTTAAADAVDGPVGYGWLGAKERSTTPESAGLTLMGVRLYNPVTARFLSRDLIAGGNSTSYTYPNDPINMYDTSGLRRAPPEGEARSKCTCTVQNSYYYHFWKRYKSVGSWTQRSEKFTDSWVNRHISFPVQALKSWKRDRLDAYVYRWCYKSRWYFKGKYYASYDVKTQYEVTIGIFKFRTEAVWIRQGYHLARTDYF